jgi:hypothetical protein
MVQAFEGNAGETTTMIPTITAFMAAHRLADVTIVADAGMISASNQRAIEDGRLSFILGMRVPDVPYVVAAWRRAHQGEAPPDGLILTQPWPAGPREQRRDQVIYYQYRADRARRTLHGIDEQGDKAERAVAGKAEQCLKPVDDRGGSYPPDHLEALKQGRRAKRRSERYDPCSP